VKGCWLYFVIRTLKVVQLKRVASKDNWSDAGTKPLRDQYFRFNRDIILGSARHFDWETFQSAGADSHDGDQQK